MPVVTDMFLDFWATMLEGMYTVMIPGMVGNDAVMDPFSVAEDGASWELFATMNYFLPVTELLSVFAAVFLLGGPMLIVTMIMWVAFGIVRGGSPRA